MEDYNGLELSLGLTCGASSKGKIGSSSDTRIEEGDKGIKIVDDFKNFLQSGMRKQDQSVGSQRSDQVKPLENFFNDLSRAAGDGEAASKRKMSFDEINDPKKLEREAHRTDLHENPKTSQISMKTEDGSSAENEDVAESEVGGSNDYGSNRFIGVCGSSEVPKEVKHGNLNYGFSLPIKDSNAVVTPSSSGHTLPGMIQIMPTGNSECSRTQPVNPGNLPVMFGYSPIQLPVLDKDHPWGMVSHTPQFHPSYAGRGPTNPDKHFDEAKTSQATVHTIAHNSSEAAEYDGRRTMEQVKGEGKLLASKDGSSTPANEDVKGINVNLGANAASGRPTAGGLSLDFSAIKPGIAADVKFGGSGSRPNLPWVSTSGTCPHGRTISGVTYRLSSNQVKIVCACHGTHMSL